MFVSRAYQEEEQVRLSSLQSVVLVVNAANEHDDDDDDVEHRRIRSKSNSNSTPFSVAVLKINQFKSSKPLTHIILINQSSHISSEANQVDVSLLE